MKLTKGLSIVGTVKDKAGKMIAGVELEIFRQERKGRQSLMKVKTDHNGRYQIKPLAPGSHFLTLYSLNHATPPEKRVMLTNAKEETIIDFELDNGVYIKGMVLDDKGAAVEGATVHFREEGKKKKHWNSVQTESDGSFVVGGLAAKKTYLYADSTEYSLSLIHI